MSPSLSVVADNDLKTPKTETVAERVRRLQQEAKLLAKDHIRSLSAQMVVVEQMAAEIADGGEAYPPGVRELASRLVEDIDAFFDPMEIIERTTIPVLAFFGELDKNIDPVQGAQAYEAALQTAGNQDYQVEVIPDVAHVLMPAKTGCIGESGGQEYALEYLKTLESWLQHLSQ